MRCCRFSASRAATRPVFTVPAPAPEQQWKQHEGSWLKGSTALPGVSCLRAAVPKRIASRLWEWQGLQMVRAATSMTSSIEHPAVLAPFRALAAQAFELTILPVNSGRSSGCKVARGGDSGDTLLVSVMLANNETGALQPVREARRDRARARRVFHSDAVQAFGRSRWMLKSSESICWQFPRTSCTVQRE